MTDQMGLHEEGRHTTLVDYSQTSQFKTSENPADIPAFNVAAFDENTDKHREVEHPAEAFLRLIGKDPAATWFRTIAKGKGCNRSRSGKDLHGFDATALEADNRAGYGIYFITGDAEEASGKNKKTGKPTGCVEDSDITRCRAVFVEWDDQPIEWQLSAWHELNLPEPTLMVTTGGKSVHCYWVLSDALPIAEWEKLQERLITYAGGDTKCKNPSRLMRLPGFAYIDKATGKPTENIATLIHGADVKYSAADIEKCLPQPETQPKAEAKNNLVEISLDKNKFTPRSPAEIEAAAKCIPQRVGGQGTYEQDRRAICGCSAALAEAGVADPDGEALRLLGHKWPSQNDAAQALRSSTTRNAAAFWAIAKENGYDFARKKKKTVKNPSFTSKEREQKHASLHALIQRLNDGWSENGRAQSISAGTLANSLPTEYFLFNELDLRAYFKSTSGWVQITDADLDSAYVILTGKGWGIGNEAVMKAILHVARQNSFRPPCTYLQRIRADESIEPYDLDQVAPKLFRSPKPLHVAMVRKWLIGAVSRALKPGCQMDYCLVLKGGQGVLKSTSLKALAGADWYTSSYADQDKDFLLNVHSCWIYELAELESITNKREAGTLKNLLTTSIDTFRKPYGRTAERTPRPSVFCGTVNKDQFLQDDTGNRRFWVVPIEGAEKLDRKAIKAARDSIWKAAVIAYENGELPMLPENLEAQSADQNEGFNEQDAWVDMVQAWMDGDPLTRWNEDRDPSTRFFEPSEVFTSAEILYSAGLKRADSITRSDEMRLGEVLRAMGFQKTERRVDQRKRRVWIY